MNFIESFVNQPPSAIFHDAVLKHHETEEIVEARRCTVQMPNGFLYLDVLASPATELLGHDVPEPAAADRDGLLQTLSRLHTGYECLAVCETIADALALAHDVGASVAANTKSVHLAATEDDALKREGDIVIAIEIESLGRQGAWFASPSWRVHPSLIIAGNALAAGKDFGAVFIDRKLVPQVAPAATAGFSPPPDDTVALVQSVVDAVETQHLLAGMPKLASYFRKRLESVQVSCTDIAEMHFSGLGVRIRLNPEVSALKLKRKLCERGLLVGVDHRSRIVILPPLAIRPAEIDVISGVLRGALLGTVTVRAPVCCAACQRQSVDSQLLHNS